MFLALSDGFWDFVREVTAYIYSVVLSVGGPGLFLIALADSSFLSVPEGNDILIVILSTGRGWDRMVYYVAMTTMGSVAGCALLYSVGRRGGMFARRRLKEEKIREFEDLYRRWGVWMVAVPSILPPPTPFKIFVLSAGLFRIPFERFIFAVALGRTIRYSMWGILAVLYGDLARHFLERNLPVVGTVLFILFVAAVTAYTVMWLRARRKAPQEIT